MSPAKLDAIVGCILGTAVGDALGLPCEGLSKQRQINFYKKLDSYHFLFGKGMFSDDTEHTCMVIQSLIASGGDIEKFKKQLAWHLRWWILGFPAGIGYATLKAICKLWLGFSVNHAGVFSAGNGAAMRSAIIGVCYGHDIHKLRQLVKASTIITHTDIKAEYGALAVALAAYLASCKSHIHPQEYYHKIECIIGNDAEDFLYLIKLACESADANEIAEDFAKKIGLKNGVTGYVYHTVPVVIQTWLRNQNNYHQGILEIIYCGGDTDTTAAILGGIIGSSVSKNGIPKSWLNNLWEYPRNILWMEKLARRLAQVCEDNQSLPIVKISIFLVLTRNIIFLIVVILHGFRRLFPPY